MAILSASVTLALLVLAGIRFEDPRQGEGDSYWRALCNFQVPEGPPLYVHHGTGYPLMGGVYYYTLQEHHSQLLFRVAQAEVEAARESFMLRLSQSASMESESDASRCAAYAGSALSVEELTRTLSAESGVAPADVERLERRLARSARIWSVLAFEGVFLFGWLALVFVPWLRPMRRSTRLFCLAAVPTVLYLPYYFGYAPMLFTFGPTGGFVYSFYAMVFAIPILWLPCLELDQSILKLLPRPLSAIVIIPGQPAAYSFMGCVGPIQTIAMGIVLAGFAETMSRLRRWWRRT